MEFIGGIDGMNFTPISNYNNYLKNNMAFNIDSDMSFENVLNQQQAAMQNTASVHGGIEMNTKFDDILNQNTVQSVATDNSSAGTFMKNISSGINGGLNSVNQTMDAANKAQEAFASGEDVSVHDVMIAAEKSALSFGMATQLRNKVLEAYNELKDVRV